VDSLALILAAGEGKRMHSSKPKVAHGLLGRPLVRWAVEAAREAGCAEVVTVVGHGREAVEPLVADTRVVVQEHQRGTGDAVMCARPLLEGRTGSLVVLSGDSPLLRPATIAHLIECRERSGAAVVVLTMRPPENHGYGRIVRDAAGHLEAIVEEKDCTEAQRALTECNSGVYCFDVPVLLDHLSSLSTDNAQGEYYLTDVIRLCHDDGLPVEALVCDDHTEALGVNSRAQLAQAQTIMQERINTAFMDAGVTMWDPRQVWIGPDVRIEADVELLPQTILMGSTSIASGTVVGPNSRLTDCTVGHDAVIDETVAIESVIDDRVSCGPRAYLRPGAHLCHDSKAGTHVEIKRSTIGAGSKVPHLSYIGDTTMGEGVNVGAGSITCNYDGVHKWPTVIGDGAFIGSDTMLVAPVEVGSGVVVGAGSTITKDVPADALAIARARQTNLEGWARAHRGSEA